MANAELLLAHDWGSTDLGPRRAWSPQMSAIIDMVLASAFPMCSVWGPARLQIYNDAYNLIYGDKHPKSFGRPVSESFPEIGPFLDSTLATIETTRKPFVAKTMMLPLRSSGRPSEWYFDFSYSPIIIDHAVSGIISVAADTTAATLAQRRQNTLHWLNILNEEAFAEEQLPETLRQLCRATRQDISGLLVFDTDPLTGYPFAPVVIEGDPELGAAASHLREVIITSLVADHPAVPMMAQVPGNTRLFWMPVCDYGKPATLHCIIAPSELVSVDPGYQDFLRALSDQLALRLSNHRSHRRELAASQASADEHETLHKLLFDNIRDGAFYCSTDGGADAQEIILAANPEGCRLLGRQLKDIVGRSRDEFFVPDDPALKAALHQRQNVGHVLSELTLVSAAGEPIEVEVNSTLITLPSGPTRSLTIIRNVSARKQREREKSELNRLETLGRITGGIAHDLNNLLQTQINNLELALDLSKGEDLKKNIEAALVATDSATRLASQLLSYSRRQALDPTEVHLGSLLVHSEELLRAALGPKHELQIEISEPLPYVYVDARLLVSTMINLVINARNAMEHGGRVRVSVEPAVENDQVVLSVTDTGCGIPQDLLSKIFEPYTTTRRDKGGSGLGLAMVEGFVAQSGGKVEVSHTGPTGTQISVTFPRSAPPAVAIE